MELKKPATIVLFIPDAVITCITTASLKLLIDSFDIGLFIPKTIFNKKWVNQAVKPNLKNQQPIGR